MNILGSAVSSLHFLQYFVERFVKIFPFELEINCNLPCVFVLQAPVVQRLDRATHWIKLYLVDNAILFAITYLLDSDLSV